MLSRNLLDYGPFSVLFSFSFLYVISFPLSNFFSAGTTRESKSNYCSLAAGKIQLTPRLNAVAKGARAMVGVSCRLRRVMLGELSRIHNFSLCTIVAMTRWLAVPWTCVGPVAAHPLRFVFFRPCKLAGFFS